MIPELHGTGETRSRLRNPSPGGTAGGANQARFVRGLLGQIQTPIRTEPFTENYRIIPGQELGRGKFAVVRKCVEKSTGREYAAKFIRKRRKGQDCRTEIIHEIAVLELATASPRVVNLHQVYEMASEMVLVLEYAAGGEIFNQCVSDRDDEAFMEDDVKRLLRQILEGVSFFHQNSLVHLDLKVCPVQLFSIHVHFVSVFITLSKGVVLFMEKKRLLPLSHQPQNILLTSSSPLGDIKIVDFGLSRKLSSHHELREIMGTPEYVAPEILNYEPISTATDMWSIGVLAYIMLTGISPFLGDDKQETFLNISRLNVSYNAEELQQLDRAALSFIQMLLRRRPQERATAEQCLTHPWLQRTGPPMEEKPERSSISSRAPGRSTDEDPEGGGAVTEELIVMAAYTLGQCRQSSSSSSEEAVEQKAITSKRFKFEEPFSVLQEVPGEFIY